MMNLRITFTLGMLMVSTTFAANHEAVGEVVGEALSTADQAALDAWKASVTGVDPDYSHESSKCMENGYFDDDCCASPGTASCNDGYHYTQGDDCFMGMGFAFATCCSKDVVATSGKCGGNSAAVATGPATGYCSWSQCIEGYDARHQDTNTNTYQCHGSQGACDGICSMLMPGKWCDVDDATSGNSAAIGDNECDATKCTKNDLTTGFVDAVDPVCCGSSLTGTKCSDGYHYSAGNDCFFGIAFSTCCTKEPLGSSTAAPAAAVSMAAMAIFAAGALFF